MIRNDTLTLNVQQLQVPGIVEPFDLQLAPGSRVALIGESGSGKSVSAMAMLQLFAHEGAVQLGKQVLEDLPERQLKRVRGKRIAMVFQEPMTALDPTMRVGKQLREVLARHGLPRAQRAARVAELLAEVQLPEESAQRYPHELSGGQRQRVLIAMALAWHPEVLLCDEPTTALDATAQQAIIELLDRLVAQHNIALLFITHDLQVVARLCQEVCVMQQGRIVERGNVAEIFQAPQHPYTQRLVQAAQQALLPSAPSYDRWVQRTTESAPPAPNLEPTGTAAPLALQATGVTYQHGGHPTAGGVFDIDLEVPAGQRLGIVGGSGSGKTTLLHLLSGLRDPQQGTITRHGTSRLVFQDPQSSLDPRMCLADIIRESAPTADVPAVLAQVGLADIAPTAFPHELSGGQRQRVAIARAMAANPQVVLADEPVSALDMTVRAQVLSVLDTMVSEQQSTLVVVSHDLNVVQALCDQVAVVEHGRIVERGSVETIFRSPQHRITKQLLAAVH